MNALRIACAASVVLMVMCSSGDVAVTQTGNPTSVSLVIRVDTAGVALPKSLAVGSGSAVASVVLTSVRVVLDEVEFRSAVDDSLDTERDLPYILDLDLAGAGTPFDTIVAVDGGVYERVEFEVGPLTADDSVLYAAHPSMRDRSVALVGYVNGDPDSVFTFYSTLSTSPNIEFDPPLDLRDGGTTSVLFSVQASAWFSGGAGLLLDPRVSDNRGAIEDNIEESFGAYEDDDGDLEPDD